jgi:nucleotide-binding universal stress UspA family protein
LRLLPLADDARVTVLHVVPKGLTFREQRNAERDAGRMLADEVRHHIEALPDGVTIEPLVQVGSTAKSISSSALTLKSELIVMGRRSKRSLRDDVLGSTAERVIRQAKVPALVVRLTPRSPYRRPAIALAFDQAAHAAIGMMLRMLPRPHPTVNVIHAFGAPYGTFFYPSLSDEATEERMLELELRATERITSLLRKSLAKANDSGANMSAWKPHIRFGSARNVIERTVRKLGSDLLVLGTHGRTGAAYLFLGTVAGDVLRQSKCDVLVVPPTRASRVSDDASQDFNDLAED